MGKNYSSEKTLPADGILPKHVSEEKPALAASSSAGAWRAFKQGDISKFA